CRLFLVFVISFQISFCVDAFAGVNDKVGGGSGSAQAGGSSGDDILIYVAAAAVVGLVVWKVISDRNKKAETEEKSDSTKAMILMPLQKENNGTAAIIRNMQEKIPVKLTLGVNSSNYFMNDKKVSVGIRYSF